MSGEATGPEQLPVRGGEETAARLARIEENLDKLVTYEVHSRAMLNDELLARVIKLEGALDGAKRVNRTMLLVFLVVFVVVQVAGGLFLIREFAQLGEKMSSQSGHLDDIYQKLGMLSAMGMRGGASTGDVKAMSNLVNQILGAENNGFLKNLQVQQELLDELAGKKKDRGGSPSPTRPEKP